MLEELLFEKISNMEFDQEDAIMSGQQMVVLTKPELDFVIKIPRNMDEILFSGENYRTAKDYLGGLVAPFVQLPLGIVRYEGNFMPSSDVIVQKKAEGVHEQYFKTSLQEQENIERTVIRIEREALSRGISIPDTYHKNFGILDDEILLVDVGQATNWSDIKNNHVTSMYKGTDDSETLYFLERGFCIHNRLYDAKIADTTGTLASTFIDSIDLPIIEDYVFGLTAEDIVTYFEQADQAFRDLFVQHDKELVEDYDMFSQKEMYLIDLAGKFDPYRTELLNAVHRTKYAEEFIETGRQEHKQWYKPVSKKHPVFAEKSDFF